MTENIVSLSAREERNNVNLTPSMHDPSRVASSTASIVSLVATMVGGGVLLLPYALSKAGIILGLFYLLLSAVTNSLSIHLLFACSRRTGCVTYEDIALKTLGLRAKNVTMLFVFLLTFGAVVGYAILVRDLSTPLVQSYLLSSEEFNKYNAYLRGNISNVIAAVFIVIISPLCFFTNLNALRFASSASLTAVFILTGVIVISCVRKYSESNYPEKNHSILSEVFVPDDHDKMERFVKVALVESLRDENDIKIKYYSLDVHDTLFSFPFMQMVFLCHFNVLPVYSGLRLPTRTRINKVITGTIGCATMLYIVISISGYLYAFDHICNNNNRNTKPNVNCVNGVPDNILNAFDVDDSLAAVGRAGLLVTILLNLPLLVLPCRRIMLGLIELLLEQLSLSCCDKASNVQNRKHDDFWMSSIAREELAKNQESEASSEKRKRLSDTMKEGQIGDTLNEPLLSNSARELDDLEDAIITTNASPEFRPSNAIRNQSSQLREHLLFTSSLNSKLKQKLVHIFSTASILFSGIILMSKLPGIGVVWNVTGSFIGLLLVCSFPSLFYLKIREKNVSLKQDFKYYFAKVMWPLSLVLTALCTYESVRSAYLGKP